MSWNMIRNEDTRKTSGHDKAGDSEPAFVGRTRQEIDIGDAAGIADNAAPGRPARRRQYILPFFSAKNGRTTMSTSLRANSRLAVEEFRSAVPFWSRTLASVRRRAARFGAWRSTNVAPFAAEAALGWLAEQATLGSLRPSSQSADPCPGLTGAALTTLSRFGERLVVERCTNWLLDRQRADGAFCDATGTRTSLVNTALILGGLLALDPQSPDVREATERAAGWLVDRIAAATFPSREVPQVDRTETPPNRTERLKALHSLARAAERFSQSDWHCSVRTSVAAELRKLDLSTWAGSDHRHVDGLEALMALGRRNEVEPVMLLNERLQRPDGSVPATFSRAWVSSRGLAQLASIWFALGRLEPANRAVAWLAARQLDSGALSGSFGRGAAYYPGRESTWSVKCFLDALAGQVEAGFAAADAPVYDEIDPVDGRAVAVRRWCAGLTTGARVAEVGCGRGRYLRRLQDWLPAASLVGIDPAGALLDHLPSGVERRVGTLLNIPAADGAFDAVLAIESLEHALLPRRAVDELCRIVRPGGDVLVIDKDRRRQTRSDHQPWERWFTPEEVPGWLARHCHGVTVERIPHGVAPESSGLFLCWRGVRSAAGAAAVRSARKAA